MLERLKLLSLQSVFFIRKINLQNPLAIAQGINIATGNVFSGPPAVFPLKENTPPNVPSIALKTKDGKLQCTASRDRIDYRYDIQKDNPFDNPVDIRQIWDNYYGTLCQIVEYFSVKINEPTLVLRLGFVVMFLTELSCNPNYHIVSKYLQPGIVEDTQDINISFLNRFKMEALEVNRWIKIYPVRIRNATNLPCMGILVDINTLHEQQSKDLSQYEIVAFFEDAYSHLINQDLPKVILD